MAFSFKQQDQSLEAGFRRIAMSQIEAALAELDNPALEPTAKVHQARKRCKKVRALIRLVRPGFAQYAEENAAFRDMARPLSGLRDAGALAATHAALSEHYGVEARPRLTAPIGRALARHAEAASDDPDFEAKTDALRAALREARERARGWSLDPAGFAPAATGMARIYAEGRGAARDLRPGPSDEAFHEWRKRVKYHWHHTRLLRGIHQESMDAHAGAAGTLAQLLGEHHDLGVLAAHLADAPAGFARPDALLVTEALIERRRDEIEAETFARAAHLFAVKPAELAERWGEDWEAWREPAALAA